jgi:hypothetical protein
VFRNFLHEWDIDLTGKADMSVWYDTITDQIGLLEGDTLHVGLVPGLTGIYKIKPAETEAEADFVYIGEFD